MAAATNPLRSALAGISPRERRMLIALVSVIAVLACVGGYLWSASVLDDIERDRAAAVDALRTIRNERPRIRQRQERRQQLSARYATRAPALTSFVEEAAHDAHVTVAQATDRSAGAPDSHHFQRRAVSIALHNLDLQSLINFMERIDGARFPVAITSIRITKRFGQSNAYDVDDMVITTWDRDEPNATHAPARASSAPSATATPAAQASPSNPPSSAAPAPSANNAPPAPPAPPTAAFPVTALPVTAVPVPSGALPTADPSAAGPVPARGIPLMPPPGRSP